MMTMMKTRRTCFLPHHQPGTQESVAQQLMSVGKRSPSAVAAGFAMYRQQHCFV